MAKIVVWADGSWEWKELIAGFDFESYVGSYDVYEEDSPLLPCHVRKDILCSKVYSQFANCLGRIFK